MHIHLKKGEKIYVNGAVLRVDRRASIEFLNDVSFLLEAHVMQAEEATTPVRQLYFIVQAMLIDPNNDALNHDLYRELSERLQATARTKTLRDGLRLAAAKVADGRTFEALKILRGLYAEEELTPRAAISSIYAGEGLACS
jgi:flagellar biosynthesis repressor protein FlbT